MVLVKVLEDYFDDAYIDPKKWVKGAISGGKAEEYGGSIHFVCPNSYYGGFIRSEKSFELEKSTIAVKLKSNGFIVAAISVVPSDKPFKAQSSEGYTLGIWEDGSDKLFIRNPTTYVLRQKSLRANPDSIGIVIRNGEIVFYEQGTEVYKEAYGASSTNCHIYLWGISWYYNYSGESSADEFVAVVDADEPPPPNPAEHYHSTFYKDYDIHHFPNVPEYGFTANPGAVEDDPTGENTNLKNWYRYPTVEKCKSVIDNMLGAPLEVMDHPFVPYKTHVDPGWTVVQQPAEPKLYYALDASSHERVTPYYTKIDDVIAYLNYNLVPTGKVIDFVVPDTQNVYAINFSLTNYTYSATVKGETQSFDNWRLGDCEYWIVLKDTGDPPPPPKEPKAQLDYQTLPTSAKTNQPKSWDAGVTNVGEAEGSIAIHVSVLSSSPGSLSLLFNGAVRREIGPGQYYRLFGVREVGASLVLSTVDSPHVLFNAVGKYTVRVYAESLKSTGDWLAEGYETVETNVEEGEFLTAIGKLSLVDIPSIAKVGEPFTWHVVTKNVGELGTFGTEIVNDSEQSIIVKRLDEEFTVEPQAYYRVWYTDKPKDAILDVTGTMKANEEGSVNLKIRAVHKDGDDWFYDEEVIKSVEIKGEFEFRDAITALIDFVKEHPLEVAVSVGALGAVYYKGLE